MYSPNKPPAELDFIADTRKSVDEIGSPVPIPWGTRIRTICRIRRLTVLRLTAWLAGGIAAGIWAGSLLDGFHGFHIDRLMAGVFGAGFVLFFVQLCYESDEDEGT